MDLFFVQVLKLKCWSTWIDSHFPRWIYLGSKATAFSPPSFIHHRQLALKTTKKGSSDQLKPEEQRTRSFQLLPPPPTRRPHSQQLLLCMAANCDSNGGALYLPPPPLKADGCSQTMGAAHTCIHFALGAQSHSCMNLFCLVHWRDKTCLAAQQKQPMTLMRNSKVLEL